MEGVAGDRPDVERYHAAALEMADEARRIVGRRSSTASTSRPSWTGRSSPTSTARSSVAGAS